MLALRYFLILTFVSISAMADDCRLPDNLLNNLQNQSNPSLIYPRRVQIYTSLLELHPQGIVSGIGHAFVGDYSLFGLEFNQFSNPLDPTIFSFPSILQNVNQCLFLNDEIPNICMNPQQLIAWGRGQNGSLGNGFEHGSIGVPQQIFFSQNDPLIFIAAGMRVGAVVTASGKLYTWGSTSWGSGHPVDQVRPAIPKGAENLNVRYAFFLNDYFAKDSLIVVTKNGQIWRANETPQWTRVKYQTFIQSFLESDSFTEDGKLVPKIIEQAVGIPGVHQILRAQANHISGSEYVD